MATPERVKFTSNLMAGFGAGFITPVNTINFATVFDNFGQKLIDNVAVWATIIAFIVIYIPFAVLSRHVDKKDALKVRQTCVSMFILTLLSLIFQTIPSVSAASSILFYRADITSRFVLSYCFIRCFCQWLSLLFTFI